MILLENLKPEQIAFFLHERGFKVKLSKKTLIENQDFKSLMHDLMTKPMPQSSGYENTIREAFKLQYNADSVYFQFQDIYNAWIEIVRDTNECHIVYTSANGIESMTCHTIGELYKALVGLKFMFNIQSLNSN